MSCTVEDELTAYVDGELSVVEAARVRTHLGSCADCRATETLLRRTLAELATLPAFEPSVGLRRRVLSEVEALPRPWLDRLRAWFRPTVLAPVAGVAFVGAVALLAVGRATPTRNVAVERGDRARGRRELRSAHRLRGGGALPRISRWWSTSTS